MVRSLTLRGRPCPLCPESRGGSAHPWLQDGATTGRRLGGTVPHAGLLGTASRHLPARLGATPVTSDTMVHSQPRPTWARPLPVRRAPGCCPGPGGSRHLGPSPFQVRGPGPEARPSQELRLVLRAAAGTGAGVRGQPGTAAGAAGTTQPCVATPFLSKRKKTGCLCPGSRDRSPGWAHQQGPQPTRPGRPRGARSCQGLSNIEMHSARLPLF